MSPEQLGNPWEPDIIFGSNAEFVLGDVVEEIGDDGVREMTIFYYEAATGTRHAIQVNKVASDVSIIEDGGPAGAGTIDAELLDASLLVQLLHLSSEQILGMSVELDEQEEA